MSKNEEMLQKESIGKLLVKMCIPSIIIMVVIVVYNMADIYFVGKTNDYNKIAAVSMSGPIFSVLQAIGTLFGGGGMVALSTALGKNEESKIQKITSFCCYGSITIGLIFAVVVNVFVHPLVSAMGATSQFMEDMVIYVRILALGAPAILFANVFGNIVRADGSAKKSMTGNIIGTLCNIILDPILILGLHMGVAGAAIATVVGNLLTCIYLVHHILKNQKKFSLQRQDFSLKQGLPLEIISLGFPLASNTILMSFASMMQNKLLVGYGDVVVAAGGIASKAGMLIAMVVMGICMGIQPAIAYNYGAGDKKRMSEIIKGTGILAVLVGSILTVVCFIFRYQMVAAFTQDGTLISIGQKMVIGGILSGPIYGLYQLSASFLQSTGKVSYATFVSLLRQGIVYIPSIFLLNILFGLNGLIFAGAVSDIISVVVAGILAIYWYRSMDISLPASGVPLENVQ